MGLSTQACQAPHVGASKLSSSHMESKHSYLQSHLGRPYLVLLEDHTKSKNTSPWNSLELLSLWSRSPYVLIQSWVLSLCIFLSLHKDSGFLTITKEPARSPLCSGLSLDINWPPMREFILGPLPRSARPFLGLFAPACGIF